MDNIADRIDLDNEQIGYQFITANNQTLFAELETEQIDAMLVHHIPPESNFWFNPVAMDGLVLASHPAKQGGNLTRTQAQAIFSGRIGNWSELGGADLEIILIVRESGAGTRAIFEERVMGGEPMSILAEIAPSDSTLQEAIVSRPGAIGYTMMGSATDFDLLSVDDIEATPHSTATQTYPFTVPLYFVSKGEPTGELRSLLAWLQSEDEQAVLGEIYGRVR
jgi:phosphate transport system substrate-binding protein